MKKIIVSHGNFASGAYDALEMICSDLTLVEAITMNDDVAQFEVEINKLKDEEIIYFVDIPGGHPFNTVFKHMIEQKSKQIIIGGFNLPLLVDNYVASNFNDINKIYDQVKCLEIESIAVAKNWN